MLALLLAAGLCVPSLPVDPELAGFTRNFDGARAAGNHFVVRAMLDEAFLATLPGGARRGKLAWAATARIRGRFEISRSCLRQLGPSSAARSYLLQDDSGPWFVTEVYAHGSRAWKVVASHRSAFRQVGPERWEPLVLPREPDGPAPEMGSGRAASQVRSSEDDLAAAWLQHDAAKLAALIADDHQELVSTGRTVDKERVLLHAAQSPEGATRMRDRVVRVFGEMAVFTAEVDDETPGKGVSKTRVTDVWLRRKGRWLFVQSHESLIE